ncbi:MAG TPA: DUF2807 domain-containing protein [Chitinophagaceae bacterium]|nr:DUF2807 domain-containing protein [Chitinophagaceae bacterium]
MKKLVIMLAAAAELITFSSCKKVVGEGMVLTETRTIAGFSGVSASVAGKINYKIDSAYKVEITAQQNVLDVIETSKLNGYLLIKVRNGVRIKVNEEIVINISAPTADYLHLSGAADLMVIGNIITANLDMGISGTGNITLPAVSVNDKITATISGSGNIDVWGGTAANEDLRISGSGKILLGSVDAQKATTTISGSGDIYVKLSQSLDATISGSGSVYYRGNPLISTQISGSGRVKPS